MKEIISTDKVICAYTVGYSCILAFVSLLAAQSYVWIPQIPFFYLLIIPLFVLQAVCFRYGSDKRFMKILYWINWGIFSILAVSITPLLGTQYLWIYHGLLLLCCGNQYRMCVPKALILLGTTIVQLVRIVLKTHRSLWAIVVSQAVSVLISSIFIFQPYPPIQYADDIVRIGVLPDSEFHDINFFCVDNSIDLQIGVLVQLGEYYEAFG